MEMEALRWLRACFLQGQGQGMLLRALNHLLVHNTLTDAFDLLSYTNDVKDDFIATETKAFVRAPRDLDYQRNEIIF